MYDSFVYLVYLKSYGKFSSGSSKKILESAKKFAKQYNYDFYNSCTDNSKDESLEKAKKDVFRSIVFVTNDKELFTNFNRPIQLLQLVENELITSDNNYCFNVPMKEVVHLLSKKHVQALSSHLESFLYRYNEIFNINMELLIKETSYIVNNISELFDLIREDLSMLSYKSILTSRLSIVLYRLFFFDLNAKATGIGNYYRENLNVKSKSYSFTSLNNNNDGFYFSNLGRKPFRGYFITPLKLAKVEPKPHLLDAKIKIAKRLLKAKVKMKIVSEALEIEENELNEIIYGEKK